MTIEAVDQFIGIPIYRREVAPGTSFTTIENAEVISHDNERYPYEVTVRVEDPSNISFAYHLIGREVTNMEPQNIEGHIPYAGQKINKARLTIPRGYFRSTRLQWRPS